MKTETKVNGVVFYLKNSKLKLLLVQKTLDDRALWQTVTGTVKNGEKLKQALVRELEEQTDIELSDIDYISAEPFCYFLWQKTRNKSVSEYAFAVKLKKKTKIKLSSEQTDYKWVELSAAKKILKNTEQKNLLLEFEKLNTHHINQILNYSQNQKPKVNHKAQPFMPFG